MSGVTALERRQQLAKGPLARLERMLEIRAVEDGVQELFAQGLVHGTTHTAQGQEAVVVAIAAATRPSDAVACTYRGHGLALALGVPIEAVLGEILGRRIGCMGGLGGSMHLSGPDVGLLPTMAIVGAGIPVAVGAALSAKVRGTDDVAVAVFGDGATNIGAFHEGLNLAAIWKLPTIFVCENNLYGEYSRIQLTTPVADLAVRAQSYDMPAEIVDGQQLDEVEAVVERAVTRARAGDGPTLIEAKTYRYVGHSRSDKAAYRPAGELEAWQARDPITLYAEQLCNAGTLGDLEGLRAEVAARVEESTKVALASPPAAAEHMFANVLVPAHGRSRQ
ncbi:MAG TPA: thiamine pyrophosphate-dependent dehydrogenase E1 component subunit alpha [Caulobacteraceae bacterium]|nr:thiamine pyrophosphate-dependent dehydrogenase E1 component subunit alpha [Caulobacteraceae bacterium]